MSDLACETNTLLFSGVYRYRLRPRFLRDVSKVDTKVQLFGGEVAFPICVAPTSMQCMAHPDGEAATARGRHIKSDSNHPPILVYNSKVHCLGEMNTLLDPLFTPPSLH